MRVVVAASAVALACAAGIASASPSRDALIRPSVGIGKVRLGMTLAQVRKALGRETLVNRRQHLGFGSRHVSLDWNDAQWTVELLGQPGRMRVISVSTLKRTERTSRGVGAGSTIRRVLREFPRATCTNYLDPRLGAGGGTLITVAPGTRLHIGWEPLLHPPPGRVLQVEVVTSNPPLPLRNPQRCPSDWRSR